MDTVVYFPTPARPTAAVLAETRAKTLVTLREHIVEIISDSGELSLIHI